MDIDMLDTLPLAKGKTYATPEVWDCHRDTIVRLYQREKKTLDQVKEIMERDYSLYATKRMFRTRIKNWGLDRKLKEDEVLEMVRLKRQRDAIGKRSHFTIRRQDVEWDRVVEYLRRRPDLEKRIQVADANHSIVHDLICRTPSPVPRLLQPASETRIQEDILRLLKDHIDGCAEGLIWTVSQNGRDLYGAGQRKGRCRVIAWAREFSVASSLLAAKRPNAAFSVLNRALGSVKSLIRDNDPRFFHFAVWRLSGFSKDVLLSLVVFISQMHQVVLGQQHPMSLIWKHLGYINQESWRGFEEKLIECSTNCLGVYYDVGDPTCMIRWLRAAHALQCQRRRHRDEGVYCKPVLDSQNAIASIITDQYPYPLEEILSFAHWQIVAGQKEAAQETLTQAGLLIKQRPPHYKKWWRLQKRYYDCLVLWSHETGYYEQSLRYYLKAYKIRKKKYGAGSSVTLKTASKIARTYEAIGNHGEANIWMGVLEKSITDDFSNMTLGTAT